jgi:hypothetical protein
MNSFEDDNLPPELGDVAKQLRDNRHEATPLELDQAKQRVLRRASAPRARAGRTGWIRKPTFITAVICALSIGAGSATAFNLPFSFHFTPIVHHAHTVAPAASSSSGPLSGLSGIFGGGSGSSSAPTVSASAHQYGPQNFFEALIDLLAILFGLTPPF